MGGDANFGTSNTAINPGNFGKSVAFDFLTDFHFAMNRTFNLKKNPSVGFEPGIPRGYFFEKKRLGHATSVVHQG